VKEPDNSSLSQTVAVVIVNYNGGSCLERCLKALSRQTRKPDRVLLVDNNSDNFSSDQIYSSFPQIEILALNKNTGFAAANNLAINRLDDMEWVVLLNPDAYAEQDWLEKLLNGAESHPDFHFFGCRMLATAENTLDGTGDVYHVSGASWRRDYGKSAEGRKQGDEIFAPSGAAALFRRDIYIEAGGLNEEFFCYMEDMDLGFRLKLLGYRCFYIADAVVVHEGAALVGSHSDFQVYHGHRNLVWVYVMNMPSPWFWIYLPQHLLYNLASVLLYVYHGKTAVILRSKFDAIKGLRRAWRQRRLVQAKTKVDIRELRKSMGHGILSPYLNRYE
jgi:GT2 family glycosyltransferase